MALMFNPRHFKAIFNRGITIIIIFIFYTYNILPYKIYTYIHILYKNIILIGFAFDKLRVYNDAINDYTKALELDNKNAFAYYNVLPQLFNII